MLNSFWIFAIYVLCANAGLIFMKLGGAASKISSVEGSLNFSFSYYTLFGLFLYIVSFILWVVIIPRFNLSYLIPFASGVGYLIILLASVVVFKESLSVYQWIGTSMILIGILLINIKK